MRIDGISKSFTGPLDMIAGILDFHKGTPEDNFFKPDNQITSIAVDDVEPDGGCKESASFGCLKARR